MQQITNWLTPSATNYDQLYTFQGEFKVKFTNCKQLLIFRSLKWIDCHLLKSARDKLFIWFQPFGGKSEWNFLKKITILSFEISHLRMNVCIFWNVCTLKPVGHQSTNWTDLFALMEAIAALTSWFGNLFRFIFVMCIFF